MTTQPSDWAVAAAFAEATTIPGLLIPDNIAQGIILRAHQIDASRAPVARELDASGGGEPMAWANPADIHCLGFEDGNSYPGIRRHADELHTFPLYATPRAAEAGDTERLDWIERTYSGMTNGERYLPREMLWGKACNGRTLREAIDKYMAREVTSAAHPDRPCGDAQRFNEVQAAYEQFKRE